MPTEIYHTIVWQIFTTINSIIFRAKNKEIFSTNLIKFKEKWVFQMDTNTRIDELFGHKLFNEFTRYLPPQKKKIYIYISCKGCNANIVSLFCKLEKQSKTHEKATTNKRQRKLTSLPYRRWRGLRRWTGGKDETQATLWRQN